MRGLWIGAVLVAVGGDDGVGVFDVGLGLLFILEVDAAVLVLLDEAAADAEVVYVEAVAA